MPFLFKCALLGKRDKLRRPEGPANPWVLFNTVGGNPPGLDTADALGNQVAGHVAAAGNGSGAEYRRLFADFVRRVRERRAWTLGLDGILNLLREFVRRDRAIRCRFLSRVLDKNLMIYPEETPGSGGRKHVLNVYQEEYELGYDYGDNYKGSLLEDVDYILHGRGLDDPLSLEHLV